MADEAKIKINGTLIPTPSEISVEINDLDSDSVRPVSTGILRRNRIRSNMLKITCTYNGTTSRKSTSQTEISLLIQLLFT